MKNFAIVICCTLVFLFSFNVRGEEKGNTENPTENTTILYPVKPAPIDRPRRELPGKIFMECHYYIGHLRFVMPVSVTTMEIIIGEEETPEWQGWISSSCPECDIPPFVGEYQITCKTDGNQLFSGILSFELVVP